MAINGGSKTSAGGGREASLKVEVLYFAGCPNAPRARALVGECVARLGVAVDIVERDGDYPSPSVRVNGRDVMGEVTAAGRACRRDVPSEQRVMEALRRAMGGAR